MTPERVLIAIVAIIVAIVAFDVYLALDKREGNTISAVLRKLGLKWMPIILLAAYGWGLLNGHWWWAAKAPCP